MPGRSGGTVGWFGRTGSVGVIDGAVEEIGRVISDVGRHDRAYD